MKLKVAELRDRINKTLEARVKEKTDQVYKEIEKAAGQEKEWLSKDRFALIQEMEHMISEMESGHILGNYEASGRILGVKNIEGKEVLGYARYAEYNIPEWFNQYKALENRGADIHILHLIAVVPIMYGKDLENLLSFLDLVDDGDEKSTISIYALERAGFSGVGKILGYNWR